MVCLYLNKIKKSPLSTINHSSSLVELVDRGDLNNLKLNFLSFGYRKLLVSFY